MAAMAFKNYLDVLTDISHKTEQKTVHTYLL